MADTAAHLVDRVLPVAGYRQWTLSFPRWLRFRLLRAHPSRRRRTPDNAGHPRRRRRRPGHPAAATTLAPPGSVLARRLDWTALLERVFGDDVTTCPRCGDRLRILAFLTDPDATARILDHLGLPATPPSITPARAPPQLDLDDPYSGGLDSA